MNKEKLLKILEDILIHSQVNKEDVLKMYTELKQEVQNPNKLVNDYEFTQEFWFEIQQTIINHGKIRGFKLVKEATGWGLRETKLMVEHHFNDEIQKYNGANPSWQQKKL